MIWISSMFICLISLMVGLSSEAATKASIVGDYELQKGSPTCLSHLKLQLECSGIILKLSASAQESSDREDRFCRINLGRQSKQDENAIFLQTYTAQVTSKEATEISKRETWHTVIKETKELNYVSIDHSLILDPKSQEITSSRMMTAANAKRESTTSTQICTYKRITAARK